MVVPARAKEGGEDGHKRRAGKGLGVGADSPGQASSASQGDAEAASPEGDRRAPHHRIRRRPAHGFR